MTFIIVLACGPGWLCVRVCVCVCICEEGEGSYAFNRVKPLTRTCRLSSFRPVLYFSGVLNLGNSSKTRGLVIQREEVGERSMESAVREPDVRKYLAGARYFHLEVLQRGKALNRRLNIFESIVNCCCSRGSL